MTSMTLRSPWIAVPIAAGCAALLYLGMAVGTDGIVDLVLFVLLVSGLVGPLFAAVRLGGTASGSTPFRRSLLAILAFPAVAAVVIGWLGHAGPLVTLSVVLVFMGVAVMSALGFLASAAVRGGREEFEGVARSLWTLVLAGAVFCLSLPVGCVFESMAIARAKAWVEVAAAEVRAVEVATGRLPADLQEILPRIGPAPRPAFGPEGGYRPSAEPGSFQFQVKDESATFYGWWIYDGKSAVWSYVSD